MTQAFVDPHSVPLEKADVSDPELFETDRLWGTSIGRARRIPDEKTSGSFSTETTSE
jgi:hypothetical protein